MSTSVASSRAGNESVVPKTLAGVKDLGLRDVNDKIEIVESFEKPTNVFIT